MQTLLDWPCEGACAVGYCGWRGDGLATVGECEEFFARVCYACDQALGEPAGCRHFLNWYDDVPRLILALEFLPEVDAELRRRGALAEGGAA